MDDLIVGRAHLPYEAREFLGCLLALLPAAATGDDLRRAEVDPEARKKIAAAFAEAIFPTKLPSATVQLGGGRTTEVVLLADAVFGEGASPIDWAKEAQVATTVADAIVRTADDHLKDHIEALEDEGSSPSSWNDTARAFQERFDNP